jgi:hypothetical protein
MDILYDRCAGLDIHKATVVACVMTPEGKDLRTFKTFTADLLALAEWLKDKGCRQVAMESTGVYWKPIYNLLEADDFVLTLANARHIKTTSTDYPHGKHGFVDDHRRDNRSSACALRSALPAA